MRCKAVLHPTASGIDPIKNQPYSSELQSSDTSFGGRIDRFAAEHDQVSLTYYASVEINPKANK